MAIDRKIVKDTLILSALLYLTAFVVIFLYELWNQLLPSMQVVFPFTTFIRLLGFIVCILGYMKYQCAKNPEKITVAYLIRLSLGVTFVFGIITFLSLIVYLSYLLVIVGSVIEIIFFWFIYTFLSFGNYLFNKKPLSKFIIASLILVPVVFIAILIYSRMTTLNKEEWITQLSSRMEVMCTTLENDSKGKEILLSKNVDHDKCVELLNQSFKKCADQYSQYMPDVFGPTTGSYWGGKIGACIDQDFDAYFETDFFGPKKRSD